MRQLLRNVVLPSVKRNCVNLIPRRFLWLGFCVLLVIMTLYVLSSYKEQARQYVDGGQLEVYDNAQSAANAASSLICTSEDEPASEAKTDIEAISTWDALYEEAYERHGFGGGFTYYGNLQYDIAQITQEPKFKVFVVPFTHVDPGWLKTYDEYSLETDKALNNVVEYLTKNENMTFMWTEISFLYKWWENASEPQRARMKALVAQKRLEITTGSWVMTDEATPYFWETIDNMIEGHQYVARNLETFPIASWTNDPFGYGATVPYLFKLSGVRKLVINRIHRIIKGHLGKQKDLDFYWRQYWDAKGDGDIFVSTLRGSHYDIPNTCGPDSGVCCQFDFKRLTHYSCGGRPPVPITPLNVVEKAKELYDQYRKYNVLARHNVFLQTLGDDFRYDMIEEFHQHYDNYKPLFDYMNNKPELNIEVRFGTFGDYFNEVERREKAAAVSSPNSVSASADKARASLRKPNKKTTEDAAKSAASELSFHSFSGDFFPYNDFSNDIWTGYFSSRPFTKKMDRIVQAHLRAADIISAFAFAQGGFDKGNLQRAIAELLTEARRDLAIFQHHDAITGTSRPHVVVDYSIKLWKALWTVDMLIATCAQILLTGHLPIAKQTLPDQKTRTTHQPYAWSLSDIFYDINSKAMNHTSLLRTVPLLTNTDSVKIVLFNSMPYVRQELVRLIVEKPFVAVFDAAQKSIPAQLSPNIDFENGGVLISKTFELVFLAELQPLALASFSIVASSTLPRSTTLASVLVKSKTKSLKQLFSQESIDVFSPTEMESSTDFELRSKNIKTVHDIETGLAKTLWQQDVTAEAQKFEVQFWFYRESRGPYLFGPMSPAQGPILAESHSFIFEDIYHKLSLISSEAAELSESVHMQNVVDIRKHRSYELALHVQTDIDSSNKFFTDSNGFQNIARKFRPNISISENYFPMAASAFIEDAKKRMTIFAGQPHGVSLPDTGLFEIVLDRMANQDDGKGLGGQALMQDNLPTISHFRVLFEKQVSEAFSKRDKVAHHSLLGHHTFLSLFYPAVVLFENVPTKSSKQRDEFIPMPRRSVFPCDVHLLNIRSLAPTDSTPWAERLLLLHKFGVECGLESQKQRQPYACTKGNEANLQQLLSSIGFKSLTETTLTGVFSSKSAATPDVFRTLSPMAVKAYKLS